MKKLDITINSAISIGNGITISSGTNEITFVSAVEGSPDKNTFYAGSSSIDTASALVLAIREVSAATSVLGPLSVSSTNSTVSINFMDTSVTSPSASSVGYASFSTSLSDVDNDLFEYDSQVLVRSPHYYKVTSDNGQFIQSAELHIYVYIGSRYSDRPTQPTYVVRSSALLANTNSATFNISEFAKSFAESTLASSGTEVNWNPFIDIFPYYTQDNNVYAKQPEFGIAYNGYGYFEEGVNPTNESALAQSNNRIIANGRFSLSVNALKASRVILEKDGEVVLIENIINDLTFSTLPLLNITSGINKDFEQEAYNDNFSEYYENLYVSEFLHNFSNSGADTVYIERLDGDVEVVNVEYVNECKYDPVKLVFVNKFGAFQSVWFFKNNSLSMSVKEDSFRRNTIGGVNISTVSSDQFSTTQHQQKNLYKTGKQSISLNSGFYPEEYNEVFRQMMLSNDVWISYNNKILPVNISDSSIDYKTSINDKLIEYSIKCDFAFDTINSIN
jgi:hypothetical protein